MPGLTLAPQHRCKNCKNKTATLHFLKLAIGDPRVLWFGIGLTLGLFLSAAVQGQEFDIEVTGQIGGSITAISGQKTRIYLGSSRLFILDASNPAQPTILGRTDLLPCPIAAIVVREDYAYVADGWRGLHIFDVSDPKHPVEVGACSTEWEAWDIALTGHYACIADGWSLRIIDVTNPTHPTEVGTWDSGSDYITVVAAEGNYVYLPGSGGRLHIIDISNPAQPTEVASWSSPSGILGLVAVKGNYAYVECDGLVVLDISDPAQPTEVGSWREADHCVAEKIIVEGSYVYLAAGSDGLCIFDVSDPTHPLKIGACGVPAYDLTVLGSHAYVSASRYESSIGRVIHIVSVSNPAQPIKIGSWNIWGFAYAFAVQVRGGYAFVGSGEDGLCIIDVSNPAQPIEVASWSRPDCSVKAIAVEGSHVYLAAGGAGLRVINVSNPAQPTEVGSWTLSPVNDIAVKGNHAYVVTNDGSLHIIDVSNPAQPIEVSSWNGSGCGVEYIVGVGRSHVYVVTAELKYSLRVIDVSNPVTPAEIGSCDIPSCSGATVVEPYVYIAAGPFGLRVVDASDPTSPREVGSCDTPYYAEDVVVVYDYAYVAGTYMYSGLSGLCIMNVSSPSHPTEVGSCDMPGFALGVTISGDYAYIADGHGGLVILRCTKREPPGDTIPPALIQGSTASDGEDSQSTLRWTNPPDDDLAQVIVRRKTDGYPSDHTHGDLIYQDTSPTPGASVEYVDTGLTNGTTYYYAVFSRDNAGNWNDQVVEGKNADTATPGVPGSHPPDPPTALVQLLPDGTEIPVGGQVDTNTVVFKAIVTDPDGDKVKLQVELRRLDELGGGFDEPQGGLKESEFVASGEQATCSASGLIPADYHWRARAIDEHGLASEWVEFGNNPTSATDFTVQAVTDTTPPALIQDFSASDGEDGQSTLSWTNPPDDDLAEVVVRRRTDGYPSDHTDGDLVYQDTSPTPGASVEHVDTGLANGTTYY
ncbi:MAG: hypothetical protein J7M38_04420, partial [Armatimonadetes bacterium]|nr:hypothetical protein [Armatimonadota bacterium]